MPDLSLGKFGIVLAQQGEAYAADVTDVVDSAMMLTLVFNVQFFKHLHHAFSYRFFFKL